ncbi:GIY-YIG nuclease family protein [Aurantibacter sp.]|uniref:GIY-YIG nuclease family protein n=1 Tax=Aurantibacter sp. TaxID=2807103 RepID=UPI003264C23D
MHYLYILHSKIIDKFYTGESKNPEERLLLHKQHYFKSAYTKAATDWKIALQYRCNSKEDAVFTSRPFL